MDKTHGSSQSSHVRSERGLFVTVAPTPNVEFGANAIVPTMRSWLVGHRGLPGFIPGPRSASAHRDEQKAGGVGSLAETLGMGPRQTTHFAHSILGLSVTVDTVFGLQLFLNDLENAEREEPSLMARVREVSPKCLHRVE